MKTRYSPAKKWQCSQYSASGASVIGKKITLAKDVDGSLGEEKMNDIDLLRSGYSKHHSDITFEKNIRDEKGQIMFSINLLKYREDWSGYKFKASTRLKTKTNVFNIELLNPESKEVVEEFFLNTYKKLKCVPF